MSAYLKEQGVRFLDLGASQGGSRARLEKMMHTKSTEVLGLDIDDGKLAICNAGGRVKCVKADLRQTGLKDSVAGRPNHSNL